MYYIRTADPLSRTARWIEKLEGGIEHIRDVVIHDSLGIAEELEAEMESLVQSYVCEWKDVVDNPEKQKRFQHFGNDTAGDEAVHFIQERGQKRIPDWATDLDTSETSNDGDAIRDSEDTGEADDWWEAGLVSDFPKDGGIALKYGEAQIALFHFATRDAWYATQNLCPHKRDMVLARGLTGDLDGIPKVACPLHKKQFSLETGECLSGDPYSIRTFPVKVEKGRVYIQLPEDPTLCDSVYASKEPCEEFAESMKAGV
jgi:nitrite reductase (NADH) large subunit